jgi:L,D-transpeptidase ErfK/SrfK
MSPIFLALLLVAPQRTVAPPRDEVFGSLGTHTIVPGEALIEVARRYDVGFNEIAAANPRLDAFVPEVGATAIIPSAWILPAASAPRTLVVNLSEMRLYYSPPGRRARVTFPIGVAVDSRATPLGVLKVVEKSVSPMWYPPPSIRAEDPSLPSAVLPGPENPLGTHALRLSRRTILIHGTNRPFGVGRKVSHGCVRLYPEDIPRLFELVEIGTPVAIVREPVKVGLRRGRVFVEIHHDEAVALDVLDEAERLLEARAVQGCVDARKLERAARAKSGVPVDVTAGECSGSGARRPGTPPRAAARPATSRPSPGSARTPSTTSALPPPPAPPPPAPP